MKGEAKLDINKDLLFPDDGCINPCLRLTFFSRFVTGPPHYLRSQAQACSYSYSQLKRITYISDRHD
jgi:hypothetical protein